MAPINITLLVSNYNGHSKEVLVVYFTALHCHVPTTAWTMAMVGCSDNYKGTNSPIITGGARPGRGTTALLWLFNSYVIWTIVIICMKFTTIC
jgi:hypothetical protein